ncbi:MAG: hypothetical protein UT21_C0009G0006 [Candidatus Woesebacteria bacterium GW2011_GWA1_39_11b]|nr:MAG: hypothetical protein UT21_C0009G0006 [Candidatus Woesebacteria bacterium GW2011_GWA1_39_11b]KKS76863.1 MAG: hypothetical protein UV51_C0014G0004 [Candidatus Woesebacteria bacterium GW2011_GWC1_42_9]
MSRITSWFKIIQGLIYHRFYINPKTEKNVVRSFHELYYNSTVWNKGLGNTYWFGIKTLKCPLDCWIYQEIIYKLKPDIIIECGTFNGGSALYLAGLCNLLNKGKVISIDIASDKGKPKHKRIKYLVGSSTSEKIIGDVKKLVRPKDKVLVILDSDHSCDNVIKELRVYNKFVSKNSYMIVEDTNINGHPVRPEFGPGPMEAVEMFLKENKNFVIDKSWEKFYLTFNPNGYLQRIK